MNCRQWREQLKSWLEAGWSFNGEKALVPSNLREHADRCSNCSAILRGALLLAEGQGLKKQTPDGLIRRVQESVFEEPELRKRSAPRWLAVPAAAAAVLALAVILVSVFLKPNSQDTVTVRLFLEAPGASEVVVVGDWNRWDPQANQLSDTDGDGVWEAEIRLQRGKEYRYQFFIDGERWVPDPSAPLQIEDGFGGTDSILQI